MTQRPELATIPAMWRQLRLLGRVQIVIVASVCSAVIAIPFAIASISHNETAWLRDLLWPHQFDPFIIFSSVFLSLVPVLLAYYHLGRLGAMLGLAVSPVAWYSTMLLALLFIKCSGPLWGAMEFGGTCFLLYALLCVVHIKVANSRTVRDVQRVLHLAC
jgi:hypothetical protein